MYTRLCTYAYAPIPACVSACCFCVYVSIRFDFLSFHFFSIDSFSYYLFISSVTIYSFLLCSLISLSHPSHFYCNAFLLLSCSLKSLHSLSSLTVFTHLFLSSGSCMVAGCISYISPAPFLVTTQGTYTSLFLLLSWYCTC